MARADSLMSSAAAAPGLGLGSVPGAVSQAAAGHGLTVHVVGRLTAPVMSFLLPTLDAMQAVGTPQALVHVDDAFARLMAKQLPPGITLVPIPDGGAWARMTGLHAALRKLARRSPVSVLHLHGLLPGLAAVRWLRLSDGHAVEVFFSPHGSRALSHDVLLRSMLGRLLRRGLGKHAQHAIVNLKPEAELMAPFGTLPVKVIESPVPQVFFDTPRREAKRPLLVSCNLEGLRAAVDRFARIAVLLNDDKLGIVFNWVGDAEPEAAAALKAANVSQFAVASDDSRAQRLSTAWIYVAPTEEHGFPVRLAEAMAAGLPCVALDTPTHRSLVADGATGFLCADLRGLLERIAQLTDDPLLRQSMGVQARSVALARFSETVFREQLIAAVRGKQAHQAAA